MTWLDLHLFLTLYMVGLIWFVQVVHYPLMLEIPAGAWLNYEQKHTLHTGWVTAPIMVGELLTGGALFWLSALPRWACWINLAGILLLWASTFLIQVPLHSRLSREHNAATIRKLVRSNWGRTVIWTLRGLFLLVVR